MHVNCHQKCAVLWLFNVDDMYYKGMKLWKFSFWSSNFISFSSIIQKTMRRFFFEYFVMKIGNVIKIGEQQREENFVSSSFSGRTKGNETIKKSLTIKHNMRMRRNASCSHSSLSSPHLSSYTIFSHLISVSRFQISCNSRVKEKFLLNQNLLFATLSIKSHENWIMLLWDFQTLAHFMSKYQNHVSTSNFTRIEFIGIIENSFRKNWD